MRVRPRVLALLTALLLSQNTEERFELDSALFAANVGASDSEDAGPQIEEVRAST